MFKLIVYLIIFLSLVGISFATVCVEAGVYCAYGDEQSILDVFDENVKRPGDTFENVYCIYDAERVMSFCVNDSINPDEYVSCQYNKLGSDQNAVILFPVELGCPGSASFEPPEDPPAVCMTEDCQSKVDKDDRYTSYFRYFTNPLNELLDPEFGFETIACSISEDCINFSRETGEFQEYCVGGGCRAQTCAFDNDCEIGFCVENHCRHLFDSDQDGYFSTEFWSGISWTIPMFEEHGISLDCDDRTAVCAVDYQDSSCVNSDDGPLAPNFQDQNSFDCDDPCIDADHDGYCLDESIFVDVDDLTETDIYRTLFGLFKQRLVANIMLTPEKFSFYSTIAAREDLSLEEFQEMTPTEVKTFFKNNNLFDCDDKNTSISPGLSEEELIDEDGFLGNCNYVDDDCDGVIDECGNYTVELLGVVEDDVDLSAKDEDKFDGGGFVSDSKIVGSVDSDEKGSESILGSDLDIDDFTEDKRYLRTESNLLTRNMQCVYRDVNGYNLGCQAYDADGDGYNNANFGCVDCFDCDDTNPDINPGMNDTDATPGVDDNCNGLIDEMSDADGDGHYDYFYEETGFTWDFCLDQGKRTPDEFTFVTVYGCWLSTINIDSGKFDRLGETIMNGWGTE